MGTVKNVFIYPNSKQGESDRVRIRLAGGEKEIAASQHVEIDISYLSIESNVLDIFSMIEIGEEYQLVYKNVYTLAFEYVAHKDHSKNYKCYMCHHGDNGLNSITINNSTEKGHIRVLDLFYDYLKINKVHGVQKKSGKKNDWAAFEVNPSNSKNFIDFGNIVFSSDFDGNLNQN